MQSQIRQYPMVVASIPAILLIAVIIAVIASVVLWRKGKTVEALLVINALLQVIIILILLFKS